MSEELEMLEEDFDELPCDEGGNMHHWVFIRSNQQFGVSLFRCSNCGEEFVE